MQPAAAVGNAGQQIEGPGGKVSGGAGSEFAGADRADFEAGGGLIDGGAAAGRVEGINEAFPLDAVAGASYEGFGGMGGDTATPQGGSAGAQGSQAASGARCWGDGRGG